MARGLNRNHIFPRKIGTFAHDEAGSPAVEFALVLPLLVLMLFGIIQFGIAFNNRVAITDGTRVAARTFSISRGSGTPWTSARTHFFGSTYGLDTNRLGVTLAVGATTCTDDATCANAMNAVGAVGQPVTVTATYPCSIDLLGFSLPTCSLTARTSERLQ